MIDTQVEQILRAHYFWEEWQKAADRSGDVDTYLDDLIAKASPQWEGVDADEFMDMVRGREPETISEHLASVSEDWAVVLSGKPELKPDCCTDTGGWDNLIWVDNIKKYA